MSTGLILEARGVSTAELSEGCLSSTTQQLAEWTLWAGKVLVF